VITASQKLEKFVNDLPVVVTGSATPRSWIWHLARR